MGESRLRIVSEEGRFVLCPDSVCERALVCTSVPAENATERESEGDVGLLDEDNFTVAVEGDCSMKGQSAVVEND